MSEIGLTESGFVMLDRSKVMTLLLVIVAGTEGKLLSVRVFRLGVLVIVEKEGLLTETERNSVGKVKTIVS